jgi:hypothetical protein
VPIPTINWVLGRFERFELVRAFLLFECSSSSVDYIHIYDGNEKVEEFRGPNPGTYLTKSAANTFELKQPHRMKSGVGLSFYYNVGNIMDGGRPPTTLFVAAAGVEFNTGNIFVSAVSDLIFLRRR